VGAVNKLAWFAASRESYQQRLEQIGEAGDVKRETAIKYLLKCTQMSNIWRQFLNATMESPTKCFLRLETAPRRRGVETPGTQRTGGQEDPREARLKIRGLVEAQRLLRLIKKTSSKDPKRWREIFLIVDGIVPRTSNTNTPIWTDSEISQAEHWGARLEWMSGENTGWDDRWAEHLRLWERTLKTSWQELQAQGTVHGIQEIQGDYEAGHGKDSLMLSYKASQKGEKVPKKEIYQMTWQRDQNPTIQRLMEITGVFHRSPNRSPTVGINKVDIPMLSTSEKDAESPRQVDDQEMAQDL
jgi:hypothetical protein